MLNLTVLEGDLSTQPEIRLLESGTRLATFQVRVRQDGRPATSVPVILWDPPTRVEALDEGASVVVVGCVRRRFFALADGRRGSRVEVVADTVTRTDDRRRVRGVFRKVDAALAKRANAG